MSTDTTTTTTASDAKKARKPRDPNAAPLPLIIAVDSIHIPANLADKARKRFSADLRNDKRKAYAVYEKECSDNNVVADKYDDWVSESYKLNLREFTKAFVANLMSPVTEAVLGYANEAQTMEFKTASRKTRISIDVLKLQTLTSEIVSAIMVAGSTNNVAMGIAQVVNRLPGFDLPENTDFSGVRGTVLDTVGQYATLMPFNVLEVANEILDAVFPATDNDANDSDDDDDNDDELSDAETVPTTESADEAWED